MNQETINQVTTEIIKWVGIIDAGIPFDQPEAGSDDEYYMNRGYELLELEGE